MKNNKTYCPISSEESVLVPCTSIPAIYSRAQALYNIQVLFLFKANSSFYTG